MSYQEFVAPSDDEIFAALGIEPESSGTEVATRIVKIGDESDDLLILSYDVPGRSIRLQWKRSRRLLLDVFREGATLMRIHSNTESTSILIDFRTGQSSGRLDIQMWPEMVVKERDLLT